MKRKGTAGHSLVGKWLFRRLKSNMQVVMILVYDIPFESEEEHTSTSLATVGEVCDIFWKSLPILF